MVLPLSGLTNTGDMAEGLTTALDLQEPLLSDLCGKGEHMVLTLKMTVVICNVDEIELTQSHFHYQLFFSNIECLNYS
jgi:hypothetical protein